MPENGRVTFIATDRLNPNEEGTPLPTIVRLYQLTSLGELEQAGFESMWRTPDEVLGDTLLGVEEVTLYPERTLRWPFERNEEARFLVAMAVVRQPMGQSWRSIVELPTPVTVQVCGLEEDDDVERPPSIPMVEVLVDDYHVVASIRMVQSADDCSNPLGCAAADLARDQAGDTVDDATPQAPETPETPSTDLPAVPN